MIRIAIQKKGRLSDDSLQLHKSCGISYPKMKNRLAAQASNFPIEILYLRDDDMAPRLNLPAKQLRRTLQFLEEEMLVKHELVDDLAMGGSQNTKVSFC